MLKNEARYPPFGKEVVKGLMFKDVLDPLSDSVCCQVSKICLWSCPFSPLFQLLLWEGQDHLCPTMILITYKVDVWSLEKFMLHQISLE